MAGGQNATAEASVTIVLFKVGPVCAILAVVTVISFKGGPDAEGLGDAIELVTVILLLDGKKYEAITIVAAVIKEVLLPEGW